MSECRIPKPVTSYRQSLAVFCEGLLAEDPALSPYSNNYRGSHLLALENTYPVTALRLPANLFRSLGQAYLDHHPPRHWDLNLFGAALPELIAAQIHGSRGTEVPWALVAHIARIEYAMTRSYYATDHDYDRNQTTISPDTPGPADASISIELSAAHPYARVTPELSLEQPVLVWRVDGQVRVDQATPKPEVGQS